MPQVPAGYIAAHSELLCIHDAVRAFRHWLRARPSARAACEPGALVPVEAAARGVLRSAESGSLTLEGTASCPSLQG